MARLNGPGDHSSDAPVAGAMTRSDGSGEGEYAEASHTEQEIPAQPTRAPRTAEPERLTRRFGPVNRSERERIISQAREIRFPIGMRGYDRAHVDRYVEQVNRLIAELEISSSPESAVKHALNEVGEETRDLLQRAHQTADDILARAQARADDMVAEAERDADRLRELAERDSRRMSDASAHESKKLVETAQREVDDLREEAARDATNMRESAEREAANMRESAAREAANVRESAEREAANMRESAERDTAEARAKAQRETDELRESARHDAHEMLASAETRARELALNAETIWRERRRLLEDIQGVGEQLVSMGEAESKRFAVLPDGAKVSEPPSSSQ